MIDNMTAFQNAFSIQLGVVLGLVFYLIYSVLSHYFRKKALQRVKDNLLEDECIVSEPKFAAIDFIIPFVSGNFLGGFIIPFLLFSEVQSIGLIERQYLPLCILAEIFVIIFAFCISCWKFAFTNKRIINAWAFSFLYLKNILYEFEYLNYSDIKNLEYKNILWEKAIYAHTYDNKEFKIGRFKNLKDFPSIFEKYR